MRVLGGQHLGLRFELGERRAPPLNEQSQPFRQSSGFSVHGAFPSRLTIVTPIASACDTSIAPACASLPY